MAAVQISASQGQTYKISDFTVSTNAPGTGDMELRWNTTNGNGKNIEVRDVIIFLDNLKYWLENSSPTAGLTNGSVLNPYFGTGTPPPAV